MSDAPTVQPDALQALLDARFGADIERLSFDRGEVTAEVSSEKLLEVARRVRDLPELAFEQLVDLCGVDYSAYGQSDWQTEGASNAGFSRGVRTRAYDEGDAGLKARRYAAVYHLLSVKHNRRLRLRVYAEGEPPTLPSVVGIWASADWYEREAFDLFGLLFDGHPDLRRILTDYGFVGHPFRKDFPLEGHVEVRYDPVKGRVVYQPVTIENRVLVPRVIRHDNRYVVEPLGGGENA